MRYHSLSLLSVSALVGGLVLSGCSSSMIGNLAGSGPAPAVNSVGMQANGVAPNRALSVQFNEAMDPSTINGNTVRVTDASGTAAPGRVTYDANFDVASFQPSPALQANAKYTLTVSTGAKSAKDIPLSSAYSYPFTTRATTDESPIWITKVTPAPNATCVSASSPITITFNEGADANTLTSGNIAITGPGGTPIAAQMSYNAATAVVTLTPSSPLPSGTITVMVKNVTDAAGVAMKSPYGWSFSTECSNPGGGGGGTSGNLQYDAPLFDQSLTTMHGQVTVDTAGNVTVQLTAAKPSTGYEVQFCHAEDTAVVGNYSVPCQIVFDSMMTDASGNGSMTAMFPDNGPSAGDFYLCSGGCNTLDYRTYLAPGMNNETFMATLVPETGVGNTTPYTSQDPLTSGTVTYSNGVLKFSVQGAAANTTYDASESETYFIHSSGTYQVSTFTTDGSGNGSSTTTLSNTGGDMFTVERQQGQKAGFIGGFNVPH